MLPDWYFALLGALLGAAIASFCGVVVERGRRGERLNGRSHCACGRQLGLTENLPIVGWVAARGTARCCGSTIPAWYAISETLAAAGWAAAGYVAGLYGLLAAGVMTAAVTAVARYRRTGH